MAKIIFTSRYMRNAPPPKMKNLIKYLATREGVEKIDRSKLDLNPSGNQEDLIKQILKNIPEAKTMLEYADYRSEPTIQNATEFISRAIEQNMDLVGKRENYVEYIAGRPRVERIGEHGLFTDAGTPVIISKVQSEIANHKGAVWTHVVSLRREDAVRLGYDTGAAWQALLRSKKAMFSKHMKIDSENLKWYAAFHNEAHHPHVHVMIYSKVAGDGFLTEQGIEAMRSELAHDIFRQDFANIYEEQNIARAKLKEGARETFEKLLSQIGKGTCENPAIEEEILKLSKKLQNTGGKKVYGYLKADVKAIIDGIVDELSKEPSVAALYQAWQNWQNEILLTYSSVAPPPLPISKQQQFKSIKNMVISEALLVGVHHFHLQPENSVEEPFPKRLNTANQLNVGAVQSSKEYPSSIANLSNISNLSPAENLIGDSPKPQVPITVATRLMHQLEKLFFEDYRKTSGNAPNHIDRKRRKKLQEKKLADGHALDDWEPYPFNL